MSNLLTFDQIQGKDDRPYRDVRVPEWDKFTEGGEATVRLRGMTSAQRDAYEARIHMANKGSELGAFENVRARLVSMCWVNDADEVQVSEAEVAKLGGQSARAVNRLFDVARELNGLTDKDIQELEKK